MTQKELILRDIVAKALSIANDGLAEVYGPEYGIKNPHVVSKIAISILGDVSDIVIEELSSVGDYEN